MLSTHVMSVCHIVTKMAGAQTSHVTLRT